jgi:hypothetical protein
LVRPSGCKPLALWLCKFESCPVYVNALVVQLDRMLALEARWCGFDSCRGYAWRGSRWWRAAVCKAARSGFDSPLRLSACSSTDRAVAS